MPIEQTLPTAAVRCPINPVAPLVQTRKEEPLLHNCTTFHRARGPLTSATLEGLHSTFEKANHRPSVKMWKALEAIAITLEQMADGTARDTIYVSSLDPGVGKTQVVVHFLRALTTSTAHSEASAIVCVGRLAQIGEVIREARLSPNDFAVFTSDKDINSLGHDSPQQARILFTTHSMIESRCEGRPFSSASEFHYRGEARSVRIWDEAILPGRTLTLSRDDVSALLKPFRRSHPKLAAKLDALSIDLLSVSDGSQYSIPDLVSDCGVDLNDALRCVENAPADQVAAVNGLWCLFGKIVTVRRDGAYGNTVLDYKETLPLDTAPLLVLDASARVRPTYSLWEKHRGGMVRLPDAPKDYSPLTIHVWSTAGGKGAFRNNGDFLLDGIAKTIDTKPNEEWLVVFHKGTGRDIEQQVRKRLNSTRSAPVRFLNWGAHDGTNEFASVPNIILAGTLFYRPSYYEALGRLAAGRPSSTGGFPTATFNEVMRGEHRHLILQALCRGAVRKCEGASCPPVHAYIIASPRSGIAHDLPAIFPGASVARWQPVKIGAKGKAGAAAKFVVEAIKNGETFVSFAAVKGHIKTRDSANFNRTIRRHDRFQEALAERGIIEWPQHRPTGFMRAVDAYFGKNNPENDNDTNKLTSSTPEVSAA